MPTFQFVPPALEEVAASILHVKKGPRYHGCMLTHRVLEDQGKHLAVTCIELQDGVQTGAPPGQRLLVIGLAIFMPILPGAQESL